MQNLRIENIEVDFFTIGDQIAKNYHFCKIGIDLLWTMFFVNQVLFVVNFHRKVFSTEARTKAPNQEITF